MADYTVFVGAGDTMQRIATMGATALNPKTMRSQVINKSATYSVQRAGESLYELRSNIDIRTEAEQKGLIL